MRSGVEFSACETIQHWEAFGIIVAYNLSTLDLEAEESGVWGQ